MKNTTTSGHKLVKRILAKNFDPKRLNSYSLSLQIGVRDLQICVVNKQTNTCLAIEDYRLENIRTINSRLEVINEIVGTHSFANSTLWDDVKLTFKSHKFSLIPTTQFITESASDYLSLSSELKTKIEEVYYYKHISSNAVNVFTGDKKVLQWSKKQYPNKKVQVLHQGSAFIEGILKYDDHSHEKMMFSYVDRGILHLAVTQKQTLFYYNQFAVRKNEDYLKYIMLVMRELSMSPKSSRLIIWGILKHDAPVIDFLKKYIRNISLGSKPNFLKFPDEFSDLDEHRYFDLFSIFLCE